MARWAINYSGWLVVEADTEDEALALVNTELSSRLADGDESKWDLVSCEEEDLDTQWQNYQESMVE